jgi:hypothetical protein
MEPTVPSTAGNKFLKDKVEVGLDNLSYIIDIYDTPLGERWIRALKDNLRNKRILEKNFCFLGFADSKRDLNYLVNDLNKNVAQINSFEFTPTYEKIHPFVTDDFQYSSLLPTGQCPDGNEMAKPGLRLKHEACNLLHRYFEDLQGTAWKLSEYYKQADDETKYSIRQLNNLCHEIESWVSAHWKSVVDPEWIRPSQITTFLNAPRYDLDISDFDLFKQNRYKRELGGVYLHWSQVGKTLYEVFRDEDGKKLDEVTCSAINHQRYYSGEFDIEWGRTIDEDTFDWKREEMEQYRQWLSDNGFDWEQPTLALGYAKIGQVDLDTAFGPGVKFEEIYQAMSKNLNITKIKVLADETVECYYPYSLDSDNWRQIQIKGLKHG